MIEIKSEEDFDQRLEEAKNSNKKILIDFHASWCGPCKMIAPFLEELSQKYSKLIYVKVDVDELEDVAAKYKVTAMPTFMIVDGSGEKIEDMVGASKQSLELLIKKYNDN